MTRNYGTKAWPWTMISKLVLQRPHEVTMGEKSNKMEEDVSSIATTSPRKVRFKPKVPPKTRKPVEAKTEDLADAEATHTRELLRRVNEGSRRRGLNVERKSQAAQVAFGYAGKQTSIRAFGTGSSSTLKPQGPFSQVPLYVDPISHIPFSPDPDSDDNHTLLHEKRKKEYVEPWNYDSYYPVTLPLRRPYSGNPELLDKEEFGEASENLEYDENSENPAAELGLMEETNGEKLIFFQFPASLPFIRRPASAKGKEISNNNVCSSEKSCPLEMPAGFMGKMLVYKSGAVKLKLGEILYDVSPGSDCNFPQHVAAINVEEKHCCVLGDVDKRAIITPDIDSFGL